MLVAKKGNMGDLLRELKDELVFLSAHLFRAHWQHQQYTAMQKMKPFPRETVLMVMDFAENFACSYQEEVQTAHWFHEQVRYCVQGNSMNFTYKL